MKETSKLNTTNPDNIIYESGMIQITILGGIRLDSLDRMRTTLKIKVEEQSIRHNLDLYNDNQTEKLVRKVAERLDVGTSVTAGVLMDLTDELEDYRMAELEKETQTQDNRKFLTPEQIKQAQAYLKAPNLMERTKEDIGKAGVIGEADNRLLMYLIFTSRKRDSPLHIISLGSSGIGKTHLQEKVSALIPEEDKLEITTLSGNAFYYFGQQELRNKLILIEDLDGADDVLYPLREIQSKKQVTKTVVIKDQKGKTKTVTLKVEGPVCVSGCTTKESLYEDNANRSFLIYIDESKEQDKRECKLNSVCFSTLSTINHRLSTINHRLSTIDYPTIQLSTIDYQLSTISYRLSAISYRLSTIHHTLPIRLVTLRTFFCFLAVLLNILYLLIL